jgi:hypothetical protein
MFVNIILTLGIVGVLNMCGDNTICELTHVHRFNDNALSQDAYKFVNCEDIDLGNYTIEEHDLCLCWSNQAVDATNQTWNTHYANCKQVEEFKLVAYKSNGQP